MSYIFSQEHLEKLRHFVHSEKSNLFIKKRLAEINLQNLDEKINNILSLSDEGLNNYLTNNCVIRIIPKETKKDYSQESKTFSNKSLKNNKYEKYNYFLDCPIESHLICVAWLMSLGREIDNSLHKECYANRLRPSASNRIYKPYVISYRNWLENTTNQAIGFHESRIDQTLIKLDIKRFFYSANINIQKVFFKNDSFNDSLSRHVNSLHQYYSNQLELENTAIPLGLISSGVIANYALSEFDDSCLKNPLIINYARYVDDLLIIVKGISDLNKSKLDHLIFKKNGIHLISNGSEFEISKDKIKIYQIHSQEPATLLTLLKKELVDQSSEWRLFNGESPEESLAVIENFNFLSEPELALNGLNSTISVKYDLAKSINNIQGFTNIGSFPNWKENKSQILNLFNDTNIPELFPFWERVFTILVMEEAEVSLYRVYTKIKESIKSAKYEPIFDDKIPAHEFIQHSKIIEDLHTLLDISLIIALSANPLFAKKFKKIASYEDVINFRKQKVIAKPNHLLSSAINFDHFFKDELEFNLYEKDLNLWLNQFRNINFSETSFSDGTFLHFSEASVLVLLQMIAKNQLLNVKDFLDKVYYLYGKVNGRGNNNGDFYNNDDGSENFKSSFKKSLDKINVTVTSLPLKFDEDLKYFTFGYRTNDHQCAKDIQKLLNDSYRSDSDIVVLPECSVPIILLQLILNFSANNCSVISGGLKHIISNDHVYNFAFISIPIQYGPIKDCILVPRAKIHPAHSEELLVNGKQSPYDKNISLKFYKGKSPIPIFKINELYLTLFNCFELADIQFRSDVKAKIDLLLAIEANKDTYYFSHIAESATRDLHCYFAQSNIAQFGDSCILAPKKRDDMHLVKIKGGEHPYGVTSSINVNALRAFQMSLVGEFKPIPPGFWDQFNSINRKPK